MVWYKLTCWGDDYSHFISKIDPSSGSYHHHHHHVALPARISLTLLLHPSLSSITPGRSSRPYPISAQLLYVGSSRLSCLCSSMWRSPQEYVTNEFIPISPAGSRMSCSCNYEFSWWVVSGWSAGVSWGVASRTCSILLAAFLCSCRQAFFPYV